MHHEERRREPGQNGRKKGEEVEGERKEGRDRKLIMQGRVLILV